MYTRNACPYMYMYMFTVRAYTSMDGKWYSVTLVIEMPIGEECVLISE